MSTRSDRVLGVIYRADGSILSSMPGTEAAIARYAARRSLAWLEFVPSEELPEAAFPTLDSTHRVESGALIRLDD